MKAEFKNGYFNACYGGSTIYEKSTLQSMTKSELIELIKCAQHNYEVVIEERNYFQDMVLSMNKELEKVKRIERIGEVDKSECKGTNKTQGGNLNDKD